MEKHLITSLLLLSLAVLFLGCSEKADNPVAVDPGEDPGITLSSPNLSGAHYNLNIIGVPKDKTAPMDDNNGHRIFVKLDGKSKIMLAEGEFFAVLDANGTDGNGAKFQLPNPDPDGDGTTVYSVYARPLGKPGGSTKCTTCATFMDPGDDGIPGTEDDVPVEVCSVNFLEVTRTKGRQKFDNVSDKLLVIYIDLDGDGINERYGLFDEALQDYFWEYDNSGLKLLQLRFYPEPTTVADVWP